MKYSVMYWLFFGGEDKVERANLSKEDAERLCEHLNKMNGDSTYSGFYVKEQK